MTPHNHNSAAAPTTSTRESALFGPTELVLQGRPTLEGIEIPQFDRVDRWSFNAVRRPANVSPQRWGAYFKRFPGDWNLRIRELLMIVLNPQHLTLINLGAERSHTGMDLRSVPQFLSGFRTLITWAREDGLSPHPTQWTSSDMHRFIESKRPIRSPDAIRLYTKTVRTLHELGPVLTDGGLLADPWPGRTIRAIAGNTRDTSELTTPNIRPETWFPLIQAAWTYISTFANDILRARQVFVATADPGTAALVDGLKVVTREDGAKRPWHPCLNAAALASECRALRGACYIFVAALSMMRDSEIREVAKGGLEPEYFGAPAVVSRKRKQDPGRPLEHWWITEPVARAIVVAEELALHPELIFADAGLPATAHQHSTSQVLINGFIRHVNARRQHTGLAEIPDDHVSPHQFRKTMSMLVATEPGAEIALGLQLKHVAARALANRSTQGYAASDSRWARLLDTAIDDARFSRLHELYEQHHAGQRIGYGPGADKLTATFNAIKDAAAEATRAAKTGDARTEYDLLRKARISLRFGKLNHCTFDPTQPAGAKCLEKAIIPKDHQGPLIDRCQPGRCPNSIITPDHLQIWRAEETSLLTLLEAPRIPRCRSDQLSQQLDDVRSVIRRAKK